MGHLPWAKPCAEHLTYLNNPSTLCGIIIFILQKRVVRLRMNNFITKEEVGFQPRVDSGAWAWNQDTIVKDVKCVGHWVSWITVQNLDIFKWQK